jgi:7-cyano-7-deazaguanine synthase
MKMTHEIYGLSFKYGDRNRKEIQASVAVAEEAGIKEHMVVDLGFLKDVAELGDEEETREQCVPPCFIPSRNTIFFGIASYFAEVHGAESIVTGHNREDNFPDASHEYFEAINRALEVGSLSKKGRRKAARVLAPFLDLSKAEILRKARDMGVPLKLTWSCHEDGTSPCGICSGCTGLENAIKELGTHPGR